jgi:hypothetical protein
MQVRLRARDMENPTLDGRLARSRRVSVVVAVITSSLPLFLLSDQPRSIRMAAAVVWAIALVGIWEFVMRTFVAETHPSNDAPL